MQWLYHNIAPLLVGTVVCALAWMYGGTDAQALAVTAPWLWLLLVETLLVFPQRRPGEPTFISRQRVWHALSRDPLAKVSLALVVLLAVPFANVGLCPGCDAEAIAAGAAADPPVPFLPFCVNRTHHYNVFLWFLVSLTAALAVRHALCRDGKRLLMQVVVWSGAGLAVLGVVQQVGDAPGPFWAKDLGCYFFSTFGYPNMGGDYFTSLFAIAFALWRQRVLERRDEDAWHRHFMLVPAAMFLFAALATLSRAAIILVSSLAVLFFAHTAFVELHRMPKAKRVRALAWSLLGFVALAFSLAFFVPSSLEREIDSLDTSTVLDRVTGRGQYHVRVATELWKEYPLFGCGGWGYKHFCLTKMTEDEMRNIQMVGGVNVHNDYLQLMAEHGTAGFLLFLAALVLLALPLARTWRRLANGVRFLPVKRQPPAPQTFFALPAPAFGLLAAVLATLVHSFGDCVQRSPAVLALLMVELAAAEGFLPRFEDGDRDD